MLLLEATAGIEGDVSATDLIGVGSGPPVHATGPPQA